jgi:hypothetical protein
MHSLICLQGGAYQNSQWINSVTKAGLEGVEKLGESTILFTY